MPVAYRGRYNLKDIEIPVECVEIGEGQLDKITSKGNPLPEDFAKKLYPKLVIAITNYKNRAHGVMELPTDVNILSSLRWWTKQEAMEICQCARDGDCAMLNVGQSCGHGADPENCPFY